MAIADGKFISTKGQLLSGLNEFRTSSQRQVLPGKLRSVLKRHWQVVHPAHRDS